MTSCNCGSGPRLLSTILYSAPGCTQCAAVRTSFGAIRLPVQKLPREPTMVTTERADAVGGRRAAADDGVCGRGAQQRDGRDKRHCVLHRCRNSRLALMPPSVLMALACPRIPC